MQAPDAPNSNALKAGASDRTQRQSKPGHQLQIPLRGMHLAVVDDVLLNRQVARLMLQKGGATVHEFADGSAFLRALRAPGSHFDAALMDIQMSPMDGLEATRLIRAERQANWRTIPIVAMTGNLMKQEKEACLAAGMDDFLPKPLDYSAALNALYEAIMARRNRACA